MKVAIGSAFLVLLTYGLLYLLTSSVEDEVETIISTGTVGQDAPFLSATLSDACNYLEEVEIYTTVMKPHSDDAFNCGSHRNRIGNGLPSNYISYYVGGTLYEVKKFQLNLHINQPKESAKAHLAYIEVSTVFVRNALGIPLSDPLMNALLEGEEVIYKNPHYMMHVRPRVLGQEGTYSVSFFVTTKKSSGGD